MKSKNKIDWNFHINFSPLYFVFAVMVLMAVSFNADAEEKEEVVVVAQQVKVEQTDPLQDSNLIEAIAPMYTWTAGGYGAFQGYNERGAQTIHTAVYRNGIPANEPGSAWYNFGADIITGETVKIITGANGVVYGSGSIAGTVLIKDTINKGITAGAGNNGYRYLNLAPTTWIQYTELGVNNQARNDNTEKDEYSNKNVKLNVDVQDFTFTAKLTDFSYEYDNCYTADFSQSNDCVQEGEKYNVAINNEYLTLGRTYQQSDYFTADYMSYENESSTDYMRLGDQTNLSEKLQVSYGVDASQEKYNEHKRDNYGAYLNINAEFALNYNFGFRRGNESQDALRFGVEKGPFFFNVGTSYRRPNLYELFGDSYVDANPNLGPEEAVGYELGFGVLSVFVYDFEESIEYMSGFSTPDIIAEGEEPTSTWTNAKYYNTGAYSTKGIRYAQMFGNFGVMLKATDTIQARVPKYVAVLSYDQDFGTHNVNASYTGTYDRKPGPYDGAELEDLEKLNFGYTKTFNDMVQLSLNVKNVLDEEVEVLPGYSSQGREFQLTINRKW